MTETVARPGQPGAWPLGTRRAQRTGVMTSGLLTVRPGSLTT